ncbi:MAG: peptidoglycan DD-metalloendopeptidase family protein [Thermodesulfobacteriota bacterium]
MKRILPVLVFVVLFSACAASGGVVHTVGRGETLWRICHTYDVDIKTVIRANHIKDPTAIKAGKKILIPGAQKVLHVTPANKALPAAVKPRYAAAYKNKFLWPVKGSVLRSYGPMDGGVYNDGIDISVRKRTQVKASHSGRVVYVDDSFRAYGNIIIIKHDKGIYTVYAHNKQNIAVRGETVSKGDIIATAGSEGSGAGYLHFEVRNGKNPMDPLFFLP